MAASDRNPVVLRNYQSILDHGRLRGSGYVSILPVDQGIEHSAGASFAPNPIYFDPESIVGRLKAMLFPKDQDPCLPVRFFGDHIPEP